MTAKSSPFESQVLSMGSITQTVLLKLGNEGHLPQKSDLLGSDVWFFSQILNLLVHHLGYYLSAQSFWDHQVIMEMKENAEVVQPLKLCLANSNLFFKRKPSFPLFAFCSLGRWWNLRTFRPRRFSSPFRHDQKRGRLPCILWPLPYFLEIYWKKKARSKLVLHDKSSG